MSRFSSLANLINRFCDKSAIGVEIGVDKAYMSSYLSKECNLQHLYAIDPYIGRDHRYSIVSEKFKKLKNATLLRMTSDEAAKEIDQPLDFIFIDGDHSYEAVLSDLINWVPKIKPEGLFAGHDWTAKRVGVTIAGTEYLNKNKDLFYPTFSPSAMVSMGLDKDYVIGASGLIHKDRYSGYPIWWLIKK